MPIYEYACTCGETFEELIIRSSDEAELTCPSCGAREVSRQMSRPAATRAGGLGATAGAAPRCGPVG